MIRRILPIFLLLLLLTSCKNSLVYEDQRTFDNADWQFFAPEKFEVPIRNIDDCYNIYAAVAIDTNQMKMSTLPLFVDLYSENGERRSFNSYIRLKNEKGQWAGKFEDGQLLCENRIREYFFFNTTGTHTLEISQYTHKYSLPGIHSLTLKVEKAKLEYPD